MNINEFQDFLRREIDNNSIPERQKSSILLMLFLERYFDLDKDIAISSVCDNSNDKGIDGIYIDQVEEEIHIFSSIFKENNNRHIGDRNLRDFIGVKAWFRDQTTLTNLLNSRINNELKALIKNNNLIDVIDDYKKIYNFVSNAFIDINTEEFLIVNSDLVIWDLDKLYLNYRIIKDAPLVEDEIVFNNIDPQEKVIIELPENKRMIIFPIYAKELIRLKGINDYTLFNKNVRYGLGNTRVNKSIASTIQNSAEKDKFILFHNGVSIVCNNFNFDSTSKSLNIRNYSMVNGAQSTITFDKNQSFLDQDIKLLCRIIEVGDDLRLTDKITINNNNQNSISMKDLRSNDPIQRRIEGEFELLQRDFDIKIEYVPKAGKKLMKVISLYPVIMLLN